MPAAVLIARHALPVLNSIRRRFLGRRKYTRHCGRGAAETGRVQVEGERLAGPRSYSLRQSQRGDANRLNA